MRLSGDEGGRRDPFYLILGRNGFTAARWEKSLKLLGVREKRGERSAVLLSQKKKRCRVFLGARKSLKAKRGEADPPLGIRGKKGDIFWAKKKGQPNLLARKGEKKIAEHGGKEGQGPHAVSVPLR